MGEGRRGGRALILVDANLLVYARVETFDQHTAARRWLDARLNGSVQVGLPWPSLLAFVRLVSNPRVFERPEPIPRAWAQVEAWLESEVAWIPAPTERHHAVLQQLIPCATRSELIPDADLAALALEHGLRVATTDGDFARFPGLQWENPLSPDD